MYVGRRLWRKCSPIDRSGSKHVLTKPLPVALDDPVKCLISLAWPSLLLDLLLVTQLVIYKLLVYCHCGRFFLRPIFLIPCRERDSKRETCNSDVKDPTWTLELLILQVLFLRRLLAPSCSYHSNFVREKFLHLFTTVRNFSSGPTCFKRTINSTKSKHARDVYVRAWPSRFKLFLSENAVALYQNSGVVLVKFLKLTVSLNLPTLFRNEWVCSSRLLSSDRWMPFVVLWKIFLSKCYLYPWNDVNEELHACVIASQAWMLTTCITRAFDTTSGLREKLALPETRISMGFQFSVITVLLN